MFRDVYTNICDRPYVLQRDLLRLQRETYLVSRYIKKSFDKTLRLRTRQSRIRIPVRARDFSPLQKVNTGCGAHPSTYLAGLAFFSDGKADGVEVNLSLPCSIEVKNAWSCTLRYSCMPSRFGRVQLYLVCLCVCFPGVTTHCGCIFTAR
jgi:hypothetical protein